MYNYIQRKQSDSQTTFARISFSLLLKDYHSEPLRYHEEGLSCNNQQFCAN